MKYTCAEVAKVIVENTNRHVQKRNKLYPNRNNNLSRYTLSNKVIKQLANRSILTQAFINEVVVELELLGWIMIPATDQFLLIDIDSLNSWTKIGCN